MAKKVRSFNFFRSPGGAKFYSLISLIFLSLIGFLLLGGLHRNQSEAEYDISSLRAIPVETVQTTLENSNSIDYEGLYDDSKRDYIPTDTPIDWEWRYQENRSDNFRLHSWEMVNNFLLEHSETNDTEALRESLLIALDWIQANEFQPINNEEVNFAWYDMAVGLRVYRLSYILDSSVKNNLVTEDETRILWKSLLDHFQFLEDDENIVFHNNHGVFQAAGQKAASRRLLDISADFELISGQADARLVSMMRKQFSEEGVHLEHSPDYHRVVYDVYLTLEAENLLPNDAKEELARIAEAFFWMIKPDGKLVNIGDTDEREIKRDEDLSFKSNELLYFLSRGSRGEQPENNLKVYPSSGYAFYKSDTTFLAKQSSFHSRTHKHADDLSFVWFDDGQDILTDSGRYGYLGRTKTGDADWQDGFWYSDPKRMYVEKTRAHNTVEIDSKDYLRRDREPFGSAIERYGEVEDGVYYIESVVEQFRSIEHTRLLVFKPGEWLIVLDNLDESEDVAHNYKQWFHFAEDLDVYDTNRGFATELKLGASVHVVSLLDGVKKSGPIVGQTEPHLQGWYSPRESEFEPAPAVNFEQNAKDGQFVTLFTIGSNIDFSYTGNTLNDEGSVGGFEWSSDGKRFELSIDASGENILIDYNSSR